MGILSPAGCSLTWRKSADSYPSRVWKSLQKNRTRMCPQEYRGIQDRHWCLLLISAEVQGQETDRCCPYSTVWRKELCYLGGLRRHYKGDLARAVLKGLHWRRLSARARPSPHHKAVLWDVCSLVTAGRSQCSSGEVLMGVLKNAHNAPHRELACQHLPQTALNWSLKTLLFHWSSIPLILTLGKPS